MKVVSPGTLLFAPNGWITVTGWALDTEGRHYCDRALLERDVLRAVLVYVAARQQINLDAPEAEVPASVEVERATLDALAAMRWGSFER